MTALLAWVTPVVLPPIGAAAPKTIVALYWYGRDFPSNVTFDRTFQETFKSDPGGTFEYHAEYWESNRFPGEDQSLALRDYLHRKYADRKVDVAIAVSGVALDFLLKHRSQLFPDTPIVFHTSRHAQLGLQKPTPRLTGVGVADPYRNTLDLALKLHPSTRDVFVIAFSPPQTGTRHETEVRVELKEFESRVKLNYLSDMSLEELLAAVRRVPKESIVLYGRYSLDEPRKVLEPQDAAGLVAQSASVPVYGVASGYVGRGIVGGSVINAKAGAAKLAEIALRIAQGTRPEDIPMVDLPTSPMFDWRQLQRWGISESRLPPGSIILFKEPTFWEQYKERIIGVIALCVFQTALITGLLIERRRRKRANEALAQVNDQLQLRISEVKALGRQLITAQEEERRRISRELHDEVGQQVGALGMAVSAVKKCIPETEERGRAQIAYVQDHLVSLTNSLRQLSHELHPALLERFGLLRALKSHVAEFETLNGVKTHLSADLENDSIPQPVALCLYRVTQESLRNVARHSRSREAWIRLSQTDGHMEITITDAGIGFEVGLVLDTGLGLVSMQERVRLLGGWFSVESRPGKGTVTRARLPLHSMVQQSVSEQHTGSARQPF